MTDSASGSADKAVQVKLVLLGRLGITIVNKSCFSENKFTGEAAVGKSSVVLRFVSRFFKNLKQT